MLAYPKSNPSFYGDTLGAPILLNFENREVVED